MKSGFRLRRDLAQTACPVEPSEPLREPEDPGVDELGITKSEFEERANDYIARARACEFLMDLRKLEREAETDLDEMPVEMSLCVDTEFDHARKRLTTPKE